MMMMMMMMMDRGAVFGDSPNLGSTLGLPTPIFSTLITEPSACWTGITLEMLAN